MEIPLPFSDTFLMEPRKATHKSAPSAKAHQQGKQKVKKTNPRSRPLSRINQFSLGPIEEGSKRGRDGSRGAEVLARSTRSCT